MSNERTNFLPPARVRILRREYFFRLGVVGLVLVTVLSVVAGVLFFPTYVYVAASIQAKEAMLASSEASSSAMNEADLEVRLKALSKNIVMLTALGKKRTASAITSQVFAIPRAGIQISNSSYVRGTAEKPDTFTITGSAATRDALRTYQLALQGAPFVRAANVPVSAYAKDTNIPFVITVTLAP